MLEPTRLFNQHSALVRQHCALPCSGSIASCSGSTAPCSSEASTHLNLDRRHTQTEHVFVVCHADPAAATYTVVRGVAPVALARPSLVVVVGERTAKANGVHLGSRCHAVSNSVLRSQTQCVGAACSSLPRDVCSAGSVCPALRRAAEGGQASPGTAGDCLPIEASPAMQSPRQS